mgnify:FL=1|tara:strand:+ start:167 stop:433 length:267 start_codon:yes stop_codon:yes gene_type:complete
MKVEDLTSYENNKSKLTVYMESDTDGSYHFLKHIEEKGSDNEQIIRYSLEMFMAEYYLIEKFIKGNLIEDRKFFKQVMNLKANRNEQL